ncbi:adenylosuccinate synthase [bacterium]|nr:adenylosuccinate synthase [bacterium]
MKRAYIVIGANYGDEGKGLITDYLSRKYAGSCLVTRFNGGAQAGHTVVDYKTSKRHVFSHFGAGTLAGAPSYLSEYFIVNPLLFVKELKELSNKGIDPEISINENALVSTPLDMLINQALERKREKQKHGSCGIGINETVTRSATFPGYRIRVKDLFDSRGIEKKLTLLEKEWLPLRLSALALRPDHLETQLAGASIDNLNKGFLEALKTMLERAFVTRADAPGQYDVEIFEGAQGLLLGEDRMDLFPHLTRSRTGCANALQLIEGKAKEPGKIERIEIIYVTRTYLTRHGAGPLAKEGELPPSFSGLGKDKTNIENPFQGKLRYGPLYSATLKNSIDLDLRSRKDNLPVKPVVALTCLDQLAEADSELASLNYPVFYRSHGPDAASIETRSSLVYNSRDLLFITNNLGQDANKRRRRIQNSLSAGVAE